MAKDVRCSIGILLDGSRVLIDRRRPSGGYPSLWEFPGGKIEADESPVHALHRELREELEIEIDILQPMPSVRHHDRGIDLRVELHPFLARIRAGVPVPHASVELRWVEVEQLNEYQFPPANLPIIRELINMIGGGIGQ